MTRLMMVIAAVVTINTAAHSQTTGGQWIALCSKGAATAEHAACESYALGVADAVLVAQRVSAQLPPVCIPAGATGNDLATLALPYVQGQPAAARQVVAAAPLMDVFREAFPCPQK
jgi:Rap1a immunity proteins